jgi:hypothetical protein
MSCLMASRRSIYISLTLQKLRMLQIQDVKGEAVVHYCEPLTTKEMRHHRLPQRVNNRTMLFYHWVSPVVTPRGSYGRSTNA